jgi:hypothetical protein
MNSLRAMVEKFEAEVEHVRAEMMARIDPSRISDNECARRIALILTQACAGNTDYFESGCKLLRLLGGDPQDLVDATVRPRIEHDRVGRAYSLPKPPLSEALIACCAANGVQIQRPVGTITREAGHGFR